SNSTFGVHGVYHASTSSSLNPTNAGVWGESDASDGVVGTTSGSLSIAGVYGGATQNGVGVYAYSRTGIALYAYGTGQAYPDAALLDGDVEIAGSLAKAAGSFKIDHPLDPANKYLYHSFVESPDMKNVYDGVVTTDASGLATITLPNWFDALNRDFRYQLT